MLRRRIAVSMYADDPPGREKGRRTTMCRWLAYSGSPIPLEDVLYKPDHSLIDQSMHSRMGVETTNADGFGVGWYSGQATPARYRSVGPEQGSDRCAAADGASADRRRRYGTGAACDVGPGSC